MISNIAIAFKIPAPKYPNKGFLVPNLRIFNFALNFEKPEVPSNINIVCFLNFSLKILKYGNYSYKLKDYYFILLRLHELSSIFTK